MKRAFLLALAVFGLAHAGDGRGTALRNQAVRGLGLPVRLLNCTPPGLVGCLPVMNFAY